MQVQLLVDVDELLLRLSTCCLHGRSQTVVMRTAVSSLIRTSGRLQWLCELGDGLLGRQHLGPEDVVRAVEWEKAVAAKREMLGASLCLSRACWWALQVEMVTLRPAKSKQLAGWVVGGRWARLPARKAAGGLLWMDHWTRYLSATVRRWVRPGMLLKHCESKAKRQCFTACGYRSLLL